MKESQGWHAVEKSGIVVDKNNDVFYENHHQEEGRFIQNAIDEYKKGDRGWHRFAHMISDIFRYVSEDEDCTLSQVCVLLQDHVDFIVRELNDITVDSKTSYDTHNDVLYKLLNIFTQKSNHSDNVHVTPANLFARSFVRLVNDEHTQISRTVEDLVNVFGQFIQYFDSKECFEMMYAPCWIIRARFCLIRAMVLFLA